MDKQIQNSDWYENLVDECKAIITEAVFTSRWALVEGYWKLGERIREDKLAQEFAKGNKTFVQDLARNLGQSERTLYYALQAYDKYPKLDKIPEGKNITWNKLITLYLPEPTSLYLIKSKELKNYICELEGFIKTCISKKGGAILGTWFYIGMN